MKRKNVFIGALKTIQADSQLGEKSKRLLSAFQAIIEGAQSNMNKLIKNDKQVTFLEKMLEQLYQNQWNNMRKILTIWQAQKMSLDQLDAKKK
jgi:hypothetical protein